MTSIEPPSRPLTPAPLRRSTLRRSSLRALLPALLLLSLPARPQAPPSSAPAFPWRLVWSDEFNAPPGAPPDPARWTFDLGGKGYGNHELETYTDHPANIQQKDGNLVITARNEDATGPDGIPRHYTSARIKTQGHFTQTYGRIEASLRLPAGKGIWPAFWMLGDTISTAGWPSTGEIDILEAIGDPSTVYSTLHGPGYSGGHAISAKFPLPAGESINTAFHLYAVEWAPDDIKFFFDDQLIAHRTPADLPADAHWAYDHPFFLILNLAVGGDWPGNPDSTTTFPQQMLVDFVRVYTRNAPTLPAAPTIPAPSKPGAPSESAPLPGESNQHP